MKTFIYIVCVVILGALFFVPQPEPDDPGSEQNVQPIPESVRLPGEIVVKDLGNDIYQVGDKIVKASDTSLHISVIGEASQAEVLIDSFEQKTEQNLKYLKYRARDLDSLIVQQRKQ